MNRIEVSRILCPVDQSEPSQHAYQHALTLARWFSAEVQLVEVVWDAVPPVPFVPGTVDWRGQIDELRESLRRFAERESTAGVNISRRLLEGPVVRQILAAAREWPADLIVLGTHGSSGFEHLLLGSVTEKVLRKALCPVLTVPPALGGPAAPVFSPFRSVLCAVDLSPASKRGLAYACSVAAESGGQLLAVSVVDWPAERPVYGEFSLSLAASRTQLMDQSLRELKAAIPNWVREACDVTETVVAGTPHEEILRLAEKHGADAIVLGVHGRNAASLAFLGSTTNQVVRAATCPVLTVRY